MGCFPLGLVDRAPSQTAEAPPVPCQLLLKKLEPPGYKADGKRS